MIEALFSNQNYAAAKQLLDVANLRSTALASNIANVETPGYKRVDLPASFSAEFAARMKSGAGASGALPVLTEDISDDKTPGEMIRNPQHPHANQDGMVQMPNVNEALEMVDLVSSSRAYEANLAVVRNARQMAMKALSIGR